MLLLEHLSKGLASVEAAKDLIRQHKQIKVEMLLKLANFSLRSELSQVKVCQSSVDKAVDSDEFCQIAEAIFDKFETKSLEADFRLDFVTTRLGRSVQL